MGATEIYVAIPEDDRASETVRCFGTFTRDLHETAQWLQSCNIKSVVMESTGVYWIPFYRFLNHMALRCSLLMPGTLKMSLVARLMCKTASGFNTFTPSVCYEAHTGPVKLFAPYVHCCGIVKAWFKFLLPMCSICRRR